MEGEVEGTMTVVEADLAAAIMAVVKKRMRQREAAERLGVGVRLAKRRARPGWRRLGAARHRAGRSGEQVPREALRLIWERYADFGPTLATEKLLERHRLSVSRETPRKWMSKRAAAAKGRREVRVHQSRARRARIGGLVQVDGSPHDWFERREPRFALIVFIDDACVSPLLGAHCRFHVTIQLLALRFFAGGGVHGDAARHIAEHGRPVSLYLDRLAK